MSELDFLDNITTPETASGVGESEVAGSPVVEVSPDVNVTNSDQTDENSPPPVDPSTLGQDQLGNENKENDENNTNTTKEDENTETENKEEKPKYPNIEATYVK